MPQSFELFEAAFLALAAVAWIAMCRQVPWLPRWLGPYWAWDAAMRASHAFDPPGHASFRSHLIAAGGLALIGWWVRLWWRQKYPNGARFVVRYFGRTGSPAFDPSALDEDEQAWPPAPTYRE